MQLSFFVSILVMLDIGLKDDGEKVREAPGSRVSILVMLDIGLKVSSRR